jgi:periplasmic mercuric ion binding protein
MKTINIFLAILLCAFVTMGVHAQSKPVTKTESFKVSGICDLCKARIEKAAKIDGVSKADWSEKAQLLTVVFDPAKTSADAIQKKVVAAGHDAGKYKADDKAYKSLPGCCQYDRKK